MRRRQPAAHPDPATLSRPDSTETGLFMMLADNPNTGLADAARLRMGVSHGTQGARWRRSGCIPPSQPRPAGQRLERQHPLPDARRTDPTPRPDIESHRRPEQNPIGTDAPESGLAPRARTGGPGARGRIQARGNRRAGLARSLALKSQHAGHRSQREKCLYTALPNARQGTPAKTDLYAAV